MADDEIAVFIFFSKADGMSSGCLFQIQRMAHCLSLIHLCEMERGQTGVRACRGSDRGIAVSYTHLINGTQTAFVGEFANFVMGCMFVLPASLIYKMKKSRKHAVIGLAAGTVIMSVVAVFINALVLLPAYAKAFGCLLYTSSVLPTRSKRITRN